jgi:hypothetical protein
LMSKDFEASAIHCGLVGEQRTMYLSYTNVLGGVLPDSIDSSEITNATIVLHLPTGGVGFVDEFFEAGRLKIDWSEGQSDLKLEAMVNQSDVVVEAGSRAGVQVYKDVIDRQSGLRGWARRVFAGGQVWVEWDAPKEGERPPRLVQATTLAPKVTCLGDTGICESKTVAHKSASATGTVDEVFANGQIRVSWSWDSKFDQLWVKADDLALFQD